MKKISLRIRNFDNEQFLTFNIDNEASLDEDVLDFIEEEEPIGVVPVIFEENEEFDTFSYDITSRIQLSALSDQEINAEMVLRVMHSLALTLIDMAEYRIPLSYLILHRDYIYVDSDYKITFVCIPLEEMQEDVDLNSFLRNFLANLRFESLENGDYVAKLFTYINNRAIFNLHNFVNLIEDLMADIGVDVPEENSAGIYAEYHEVEEERNGITYEDEDDEDDLRYADSGEGGADIRYEEEEEAGVRYEDEEEEETGLRYEDDDEDGTDIRYEEEEDEDEDDIRYEDEDDDEEDDEEDIAFENSDDEEDEEEEDITFENLHEEEEDEEEDVVTVFGGYHTGKTDRETYAAEGNYEGFEEPLEEPILTDTSFAEADVNEDNIEEPAEQSQEPLEEKAQETKRSIFKFKTENSKVGGVVIEDEIDNILASDDSENNADRINKGKKSIKINRATLVQNTKDELRAEESNLEEAARAAEIAEEAGNTVESFEEEGKEDKSDRNKKKRVNKPQKEKPQKEKPQKEKVQKEKVQKEKPQKEKPQKEKPQKEKVIPKVNPYIIRINTDDLVMIQKQSFKIGKSNRADYTIDGNVAVSRVHAIISNKDGEYYIKDNKSTNHTYVNGKLLNEGEEVPLKDDSKIILGDEEFIFKLK